MQEERSSEFGLLHANLRSLEKAGRILILKHESFLDESEEVRARPFVQCAKQLLSNASLITLSVKWASYYVL
jgi:hypothetical protein